MPAPLHVGPLLLFSLAPALTSALRHSEPAKSSSRYFWPQPRGRPDSYGVSAYTVPRRNTKKAIAWTWTNGGPRDKYKMPAHTGLVIDDEKSIYLCSVDGIRKLNSEGDLLWFLNVSRPSLPSLEDGKAYTSSSNGTAMALSMGTGEVLWTAKYTEGLGTDISGVAVQDGVLLGASHGNTLDSKGGSSGISAMDPSDGHILWEIMADAPIWGFTPIFTGKGSFVFQDQLGGLYHVRTADGKIIWKSGTSGPGAYDTTHSLPMVYDGMVYAVHSEGPCCTADQMSTIGAYNLANGELIWEQDFARPVNTQPVVGHLGRGTDLMENPAVVVPIGSQPTGQWGKFEGAVRALDAKTGEKIWEWASPTFVDAYPAGIFVRMMNGQSCHTESFASPVIDARGTVYFGHFDGRIYALRDDDGDGQVNEHEESWYHDTQAAFGHNSVALAPGMLVAANCNGLYVWKE